MQLNAYSTSGQVLGCPLFTLGAEICLQDERILHARILEFLSAVDSRSSPSAIAEAQAAKRTAGGRSEGRWRASC